LVQEVTEEDLLGRAPGPGEDPCFHSFPHADREGEHLAMEVAVITGIERCRELTTEPARLISCVGGVGGDLITGTGQSAGPATTTNLGPDLAPAQDCEVPGALPSLIATKGGGQFVRKVVQRQTR
jgi:hypothetical protein